MLRRRIHAAAADTIKSLEDSAARPSIVREAEVWAESEVQEVEAVRDQLNAYVLMRNMAVRADLIEQGEHATLAAIKAQILRQPGESDVAYGKRIYPLVERFAPEAPGEPVGPSWDTMRAEAERLRKNGVVLDASNYEAMQRDLDQRDAADVPPALGYEEADDGM